MEPVQGKDEVSKLSVEGVCASPRSRWEPLSLETRYLANPDGSDANAVGSPRAGSGYLALLLRLAQRTDEQRRAVVPRVKNDPLLDVKLVGRKLRATSVALDGFHLSDHPG